MPDPLPVCHLNGEFLALSEARISPLDRGFLFADSVYEVLPVFAGRMFRFREHFDRLERSLAAIGMKSPHSHEQWAVLLHELIRRNGGRDMYLYVQVTRGAEYGRNHAAPSGLVPTVFAMASPLPASNSELRRTGLSAITVEDTRWARCDIKSTALLPNVLAKQQAAEAGAQEALFVRDGELMEGSSMSVFVVAADEVVATPPNSNKILPGTSRDVVIELASTLMRVEIRPVTVDELRAAREVWVSAATRNVLPVTRIDGRPVGDGRPGPAWQRVAQAFDHLIVGLAATPVL